MSDASRMHGEALAGVSQEELLQELPVEQSDLIPLAALVERLSNNAYQTLQSLSDTTSSLSNDAKKAKIFATAMDLRKQFVKLLVLVRWSKDVELLNKARNVIALLVDQQWAHEDVFSGLTQARKILPNARICDADLVTAIDVIRTGTYQRLPASIRNSTVPKAPMTNAQVLDVLRALDQVLRVRLTCNTVTPQGFHLQKIADGKAYFAVEGLYDACLTTSGPTDEDRWWLLDFHFADAATDGDEDLSASLTTPYLENVFAAAEAMLSEPTSSDEPILVRLHTFLEQQALQRQLHILHHQLQRVNHLHLRGNVRFSLDLATHTLELQYWAAHASASAQDRNKALHRRLLQGKLHLKLHTETLTGANKVLSDLLSGSTASTGHSHILVDWDVDEAIREATKTLPELHLEQLDIEALVLAATDRHSLALMKIFQQQIVDHPGLGAGNAEQCVLRSLSKQGFGPRHALELQVTDNIHIMLYVSLITGRIGIKSLDLMQSQHDEVLQLGLSEAQDAALQRMANQISANTETLAETLLTFRLQSLAKELELQASWLGLAYLPTIALRPGELDKIGLPSGYPLLYLPLGILPSYYMSIYFVPKQPITMALVSVMSIMEAGKAMQVISSVKWLDRKHLANVAVSGKLLLSTPNKAWSEEGTATSLRYDLTSEELQLAYNYCIATVAYSHLEEQLRLKLIPFMLVGATTDNTATLAQHADPLLPSLRVSAAELVSPFASLTDSNVSLQICDWWLPADRRVEISLRIKLEAPIDSGPITLFNDTSLDPATGQLRHTSRDLATSVAQFQRRWDQVARMLLLINTVAQYKSAHHFHIALSHVENNKVALRYGATPSETQLSVSITFNELNERLPKDRFELEFGVLDDASPEASNPHEYLAALMQNKLNTIASSTTNYWKGLITVRWRTCAHLDAGKHLAFALAAWTLHAAFGHRHRMPRDQHPRRQLVPSPVSEQVCEEDVVHDTNEQSHVGPPPAD